MQCQIQDIRVFEFLGEYLLPDAMSDSGYQSVQISWWVPLTWCSVRFRISECSNFLVSTSYLMQCQIQDLASTSYLMQCQIQDIRVFKFLGEYLLPDAVSDSGYQSVQISWRVPPTAQTRQAGLHFLDLRVGLSFPYRSPSQEAVLWQEMVPYKIQDGLLQELTQ